MGYLFPALDLCVGVDTWDVCVSSCIMGDESSFCDEQAPWCGTTLGIVGCMLRPRDMGGMRSEAGQWGKHNAVLEGYPADLDGFEERGRLLRRGHGWCELDNRENSCAIVKCPVCMPAQFIVILENAQHDLVAPAIDSDLIVTCLAGGRFVRWFLKASILHHITLCRRRKISQAAIGHRAFIIFVRLAVF